MSAHKEPHFQKPLYACTAAEHPPSGILRVLAADLLVMSLQSISSSHVCFLRLGNRAARSEQSEFLPDMGVVATWGVSSLFCLRIL